MGAAANTSMAAWVQLLLQQMAGHQQAGKPLLATGTTQAEGASAPDTSATANTTRRALRMDAGAAAAGPGSGGGGGGSGPGHVQVVNGAFPGTGSNYMNICLKVGALHQVE